MCPNCGCPIEKKIYCEECGQELSVNDRKCPNCGCPTKDVLKFPQALESIDTSGNVDKEEDVDFEVYMYNRPKHYIPLNLILIGLFNPLWVMDLLTGGSGKLTIFINPLAWIGVLYGCRVIKAWGQGLTDDAKSHSLLARRWAIITLIVDIILCIVVLAIYN